MSNDLKVAVLIDAENISAKYATTILQEAANLGNVIYKRIYGNWTTSQLGSWKNALLDNAIQPIQQYSNTAGKNSSDSALIIDAMDLLYQKKLDVFCIVSSDSDFTRLASRLRESEIIVLGMGEKKTPRAFISACNKFVYLDLLYNASKEEARKKKSRKRKRSSEKRAEAEARELAATATSELALAPEGAVAEAIEVAEAAAGIAAGEREAQRQSTKEAKPARKRRGKAADEPKQEEKAPAPELPEEVDDTDEDEIISGSDIEQVKDTLRAICEDASDDDGWIPAANLAELLSRRLTDFDMRNFGFKKFVPFVESLKMFESKSVSPESAPGRTVYFRLLEDWTK